LKFTQTSKNPEVDELQKTKRYPIGLLGDDVEIHFLHYKNEEEAAEKWTRRTKRINFDNLFFILSSGQSFKEELLQRYLKLPFSHKLFISTKTWNNYDNIIFVREIENSIDLRHMVITREYERYVDLTKWLNGDNDFVKKS
jgi:uncharacterized protein (DUF1919 family)